MATNMLQFHWDEHPIREFLTLCHDGERDGYMRSERDGTRARAQKRSKYTTTFFCANWVINWEWILAQRERESESVREESVCVCGQLICSD